jgi:hypothetical protein
VLGTIGLLTMISMSTLCLFFIFPCSLPSSNE